MRSVSLLKDERFVPSLAWALSVSSCLKSATKAKESNNRQRLAKSTEETINSFALNQAMMMLSSVANKLRMLRAKTGTQSSALDKQSSIKEERQVRNDSDKPIHLRGLQDCVWTQLGETLEGEFAGDEYGWALDMSDNGETLVVGARLHDKVGGSGNEGYARVYRLTQTNETTTTWKQVGEDLEGERQEDRFGFSVALSGDGSTVAVGSIFFFNQDGQVGQVRIYGIQDDRLALLGSPINGEFHEDTAGYTVKLSEDGKTVAFGAPFADSTGDNTGEVRIFELQNGSWMQKGSDINGIVPEDKSGFAIDISSDGDIVAIGIPFSNIEANGSGETRVYQFNSESGDWDQMGSPLKDSLSGDQSGYAISISHDGKTVAVGSNDTSGDRRGHVWVYRYDEDLSDWALFGPRIDGIGVNSLSGWAVALSGDATTLAIGAPAYTVNGGIRTGQVGVYNFSPVDEFWYRSAPGITADNPDDQLGYAVSLSADGGTLFAGAPYTDTNGLNSGSAQVFRLSSRECLENPPLLPDSPESESSALILALGVGIPMFVIFILAILAWYCLRQRRPRWWQEKAFDCPDIRDTEYKFFISHRGSDTKNALARPLHYILKGLGYRYVLRKRLFKPLMALSFTFFSSFFDQRSIETGKPNEEEIARGLHVCQYGVVIISDNFLESKWCRRELKTLYDRLKADQQFQLLVFFQSEHLIQAREFKQLKEIGAVVRTAGYSDRQHLLNEIVPLLDARDRGIKVEQIDVTRASSYIAILNKFCKRKDVMVPPGLHDVTDPSHISVSTSQPGQGSRGRRGLTSLQTPNHPRRVESRQRSRAEPQQPLVVPRDNTLTDSRPMSVSSWNTSQQLPYVMAREVPNSRPHQHSGRAYGPSQGNLRGSQDQAPVSSYPFQTRQDIGRSGSFRRGGDPPSQGAV